MCAKLSFRDLNLDHCPPHFTRTYTCGVVIAPRVCGKFDVTKNMIGRFQQTIECIFEWIFVIGDIFL